MSGWESVTFHAGIDPEHINLQRANHPGAEFLIHPECGCATSAVEAVSAGDVDPEAYRSFRQKE
jgi:quinolinate synthase